MASSTSSATGSRVFRSVVPNTLGLVFFLVCACSTDSPADGPQGNAGSQPGGAAGQAGSGENGGSGGQTAGASGNAGNAGNAGSAGNAGNSGNGGNLAGSGGDSGAGGIVADWSIVLDTNSFGPSLTPALLGQYDLSGELYHYAENEPVKQAMHALGPFDWRVGLGRWEVMTQLLPQRTDGVSCTPWLMQLPQGLQAPQSADDLSLIAQRDWFIDNGATVTVADTNDDSRYSLDYIRNVIDTANVFNATPFVSIDLMPRALAKNKDFSREGIINGLADPCLGTFSNSVSNSPPQNPTVFAAAAQGMVKRVVEGAGAEPGRNVYYWEFWNEYELNYAWTGTSDEYFETALTTLVTLHNYRQSSSSPRVSQLRFGLGSFAHASTAAAVIETLDTTPIAGVGTMPLDFISFHSYANDPDAIVNDIKAVTTTRGQSTNYTGTELVLAEWGPALDNSPPSDTLDISLLVSSVLSQAPYLGVTRTHHSLFVDFVEGFDIPFALLTHQGTPKPLYYAYQMFQQLIADNATLVTSTNAPEGKILGELASVIVVKTDTGRYRALFVNRGDNEKTAELRIANQPIQPTSVWVFSDPTQPPKSVTATAPFVLPARAIVLVEQ